MSNSDANSLPELIELTESLNDLVITDFIEPDLNNNIPAPQFIFPSLLSSTHNTPSPSNMAPRREDSPSRSSPDESNPNESLLHKLPMNYARDSMMLFNGSSQEIEEFIDNYEATFKKAKIVTDSDKVKGIMKYVTERVRQFIRGRKEYQQPDWEGLKKELLYVYDAERNHQRWRMKDIKAFTAKSTQKSMTTKAAYLEYYRNFSTIADQLIMNEKMRPAEYDVYFWIGLPKKLRDLLQTKIERLDPSYDTAYAPNAEFV
jgi:hypothetical protein